MDYCYITEDLLVITEDEIEKQPELKERVRDTILVSNDRGTGMVTAHVVERKGSGDEWQVRRVVKDIEEAGYKGCIIRRLTDQEPAVIDLQGAIGEARQGEARREITIPANSVVVSGNKTGELRIRSSESKE